MVAAVDAVQSVYSLGVTGGRREDERASVEKFRGYIPLSRSVVLLYKWRYSRAVGSRVKAIVKVNAFLKIGMNIVSGWVRLVMVVMFIKRKK